MQIKFYRAQAILMPMKGYVLVTTSGIMFFIIAAITVMQLMSGRAMSQQYKIAAMNQDVLNRLSIKNIIAKQIAENETTIILPDELNTQYALAYYSNSDGSIDVLITNNDTQRVSSVNITLSNQQASQVQSNVDNVQSDAAWVKGLN